MSDGINKKGSFVSHPLEGARAHNMGTHDRIPSDPDMQERQSMKIASERSGNF
jgi:hypothetical protein